MPRFFTSSAEKARRTARAIDRLNQKEKTAMTTPAPSSPENQPVVLPLCCDSNIILCLGALQYYGPMNAEQLQINLSRCGMQLTLSEIERALIFCQNLKTKK